jgi:ethanolamine utilization protein EutQ (cupin superfamily)
MVKVGDMILINAKVKAVVTTLFEVENGNRWFIGYKKTTDGSFGFFLEGDEEFKVIEKNNSNSYKFFVTFCIMGGTF